MGLTIDRSLIALFLLFALIPLIFLFYRRKKKMKKNEEYYYEEMEDEYI